MRILVSGATGLIGTRLAAALRADGDDVVALSRSGGDGADGTVIRWDPAAGAVDRGALAGFDAVVHLAGEPLAGGRWTAAKKQRIRRSRVEGTRLIAGTLAGLDPPPRTLLCASAVGFYGDRGDQVVDEASPAGEGFLAEVCQAWEEAAHPARDAGIRVVHLRFGLVLSPEGGALSQMLLPFRLGLGGVIGNGRQYWSWIGLDDAVRAARHALAHDALEGPVNVVTPSAVTCREFVKTMGRVLRRPTFAAMPAFAARLVFGEMADETLLASTRVRPARLAEHGYTFRQAELEPALAAMLRPN
ncbi:MAG: TIGR01777 family oxidoreductase [Planctomycetota bacterium]|jgi:uncharacterized protein (TIGR01777 family)